MTIIIHPTFDPIVYAASPIEPQPKKESRHHASQITLSFGGPGNLDKEGNIRDIKD